MAEANSREGSIRVAQIATTDLTPRFLLLGQLRRLRDEGFDVSTITAPGRWTSDLEMEGFHHVPWPHATRSWDPLADARAFVELVRILKQGRFDIVHTHNPKPGVMGRIASRIAGVPCIVNTVHGLYAQPDDAWVRRTTVLGLERIAARFSDLELYQSREDLDWARRIKAVSRSKSVFIGNGVDLSRFDRQGVAPERAATLRAALGIPERAVVIGTVGRLVAEKGYRELVAAARSVKSQLPETVFIAVGGSDSEKDDALSDPEIRAAADVVVFTGWREDIRDLLALMDVFVLASWREGLPRSAIEAAVMGLPLVLTNIRGCRDVARDGVEGLLVPPRDATSLATAIDRLVRDPELRAAMGEAARARAVSCFDESRITDRIVGMYRDLLGRKGVLRADQRAVRIRPARPRDAKAIARVHAESLPDAFLPALGARFLEHLYRELATDPKASLLVAENGRVVGFAAGVVSVPKFYRRFFLKHGVAATVAAGPRLFRPNVLKRARETARYPASTRTLPASELLSIALLPEFRRSGMGRVLADGVIRDLGVRGAGEIKVVVGPGNETANRFYQSLGFRRVEPLAVHAGTASTVWVK